MYRSEDTIAAVATASGAGGVGIIRLSGSRAAAIVAEVSGRAEDSFRERFLHFAALRDGDELIDETLCVVMRGPRSFTGEDVAEIHAHGGSANLGRILRRVIAAGARHAEPGEFTRRAFENGKLDLTRAEAIVDIVNASSERALRVAQSQLRGELGTRIDTLISDVTGLLAEIEAGIDFPEEGLDPAEQKRQVDAAEAVAARCESLASSYGVGRVLRDGVEVALCGPVNAGKSSLFNALVGQERALVAPEAGTTRDYVEAQVVWGGVSVTLIDTAGLREAGDSIEGRGIELGVNRAAEADIELVVREPGESAPTLSERQMLVYSKADLHAGEAGSEGLFTSAKSGLGIDALKAAILDRVTEGHSESAEGCVVTNERQRSRLEAAGEAMRAAAGLIAESAPSEVVVIELNSARQKLAEVTGEEVGDEMLDELFARFCIGK